jgi:hypothetical protein
VGTGAVPWYDHLVTTTGTDIPDERDTWFVGDNGIAQPWHDWMAANGINLGRIPMWPEVVLDHGAGTMQVEHFINCRHGHAHYPVLLWNRCPTQLVQMPLRVPPGDLLWGIYNRERVGALLDRQLAVLGKHGATVVRAATGSTLIFVSRGAWAATPEELRTTQEVLKQALPGVEVLLLSGADTIIHKRPEQP